MATIIELRRRRDDALSTAESSMRTAEGSRGTMTANENRDYRVAMAAADALTQRIAAMERQKAAGHPIVPLLSSGEHGALRLKQPKEQLSPGYADDFFAYIGSGGSEVGAALYEGSNTAGGFAVPVTVDDQVVPLAPQEMAIRRLATVVPTKSDIRLPQKTAFGSAAAKAESGASANSFTGTAPTLGQFTLSAFMAGVTTDVTFELAQDAPTFLGFTLNDFILDLQMYEENLFINGTGTGQAQGLIGNVGVGVTEEPDANGNLISISGTEDLVGALNATYHPNARWVMTRASAIIIRKAQVGADLFEPVWRRENGKDVLHGYPVEYVEAMPSAARGNAPVLFGDFARGYIIGDRGGSAVNIKVLDQAKAAQGLMTLIAYRRTDGRVQRSEAIQQYNIAAS